MNHFTEPNYINKFTTEQIEIELLSTNQMIDTEIERTIFDLQQKIDDISSHTDNLDYYIAVASGILCGMLDVLWVSDFDFREGRAIADEKANDFVVKVAKLLGCEEDDIKKSVAFLEQKFPIPSDGNTPDFGGGLQHHVRDFAHHPTIVGLLCSLLTQFTMKSYGTDVNGNFIIVPVPEKSLIFIGKDVPDKIIKGTLVWFFHLVSDLAGSSSTAGLSGGTGIPGPILSLAKELSVLPFMKELKVNNSSLSVFLSKAFNGTLFAKSDENGDLLKDSILKFDLRGELGLGIELGKQAIPVIANDCMVRSFYFIRRLMIEIKANEITNLKQFQHISWDSIKPYDKPTLTRMLTIATGVFTTIDLTDALLTQKYWVSVNFIGVGRFTLALGSETIQFMRVRNVKRIKLIYEKVSQNTFKDSDNRTYGRLGDEEIMDKFGLTLEQTELLYNLELQKTLHDVDEDKENSVAILKKEWIDEWKKYISLGFAEFTNVEGAKIKWYNKEELLKKFGQDSFNTVWFKLVMLEAMLFEPYYILGTEIDKKGNEIPSKKYDKLNSKLYKYKKSSGDLFLDSFFDEKYYPKNLVKRFRKTYREVRRELTESLKSSLKGLTVGSIVLVSFLATAGIFSSKIAVVLVGAKFANLSGAALTSACLAYLGNGAIAAGGYGMMGGMVVVVGGGAILGFGVGAGVGGLVAHLSKMNKEQTILQSAKLLVSVREIFLNDEHDIEYSTSIYEQYVENISEIEKGLVELRLKADVASKEEKKELKAIIEETEKSVKAMKIARKSMNRFKSAFEEGMSRK